MKDRIGMRIDTGDQHCEKCGKITRHTYWTAYDEKGRAMDRSGGCVEHQDPCPDWAMCEEELEYRKNQV